MNRTAAAVVCGLYSDGPEPWNSALRDAGAGIRLRRWTDDSVRAALAEFWVAHGRPPAGRDLSGGHWRGAARRDPEASLRRRDGRVEPARAGAAQPVMAS